MFYQDNRLQYPVRVETPNPVFAKALQQAIGGGEGEMRVALQYMFQAWGARGGDPKFRDLLLNTAAEELGHIEMLATAVALNLEGAPTSMQEESANDPVAGAVLNGMNLRHTLSTGLAALPEDSSGTPFNASHVYASGNIAADMLANAARSRSSRHRRRIPASSAPSRAEGTRWTGGRSSWRAPAAHWLPDPLLRRHRRRARRRLRGSPPTPRASGTRAAASASPPPARRCG
jgi:Mn-containing catalase